MTHPASIHDCAIIDIILVGCVKGKRHHAAPARNLYTSTAWKYRQQYAELHGHPWFILSAKHGLLGPDDWIEPYDMTLKTFSAPERREWSSRVLDNLVTKVPDLRGKNIEVHAGKDYVGYGLEDGLREAGAVVYRPLAHVVGQGRQHLWYQEHMATCTNNR